MPQPEKDKLAWECPESNRGYVSQGREKVTQLVSKEQVEALRNASPDLKESCNLPWLIKDEIGKEPSKSFQNRWPESDKLFRSVMMEFFKICNAKSHNLRQRFTFENT